MFDLPEYMTIARQMNETIEGAKVLDGTLGNSPGKFIWYNRTHEEFSALVADRTVGHAYARGKWVFVPLEPDYLLAFGDCGGKIMLHQPGTSLPKKYHLLLRFTDGSFMTATTQMWGAMELYIRGDELERPYIKDMRPTPVDPEFTYVYFSKLVAESGSEKKRSVKALLTQDQLIPGLGNAIAQDIMFNAGLHPRHDIDKLDDEQMATLYKAILSTVEEITSLGGRYDEYDFYGEQGRYVRLMDRYAPDRPCPRCGGDVKKIQYLGGANYVCESCQVL